jgi:autoinducer 2-degrading protein
MYVTLVSVNVLPEHVEAFLDAIRVNHEGSIREPGCLRFDVLRSPDDPTRFLLYEAFVDEAAAAAHKETSHYLAFRDAAAPWMAEPRTGVRWDGLYPELPLDPDA